MLNYSFSGYKEYGSSEDSDDAESKYLALQPGFNLGPWRFRNYSNWSSNNGESGSWNSVYNYLQRDIIALKKPVHRRRQQYAIRRVRQRTFSRPPAHL